MDPGSSAGLLIVLYRVQAGGLPGVDPPQLADPDRGDRLSGNGAHDSRHQRAGLHPIRSRKKSKVPTTLVDQILAGQDLYSVQCVECHGDDGSVSVITGVEGLEGKEISPINGTDVLYTLTDPALHEVIAYGRPNAGMTPFGKSYGGELSTSEIDYIVTFMRYMWDDRFEIPQEALKPLFPALADGEVPSYDVHIAPIVKRYCISCHRAGKDNNEYLMTTYEEIVDHRRPQG